MLQVYPRQWTSGWCVCKKVTHSLPWTSCCGDAEGEQEVHCLGTQWGPKGRRGSPCIGTSHTCLRGRPPSLEIFHLLACRAGR